LLAKIHSRDPAWEAVVPPIVAQMIKKRRHFNCPAAVKPDALVKSG
jgi:hypothetical protein